MAREEGSLGVVAEDWLERSKEYVDMLVKVMEFLGQLGGFL